MIFILMLLTILIVLLLIFTTLLYYQFFLKPKKLMQFYRNAFKSSFKVYEYPFDPLQASQFTTMKNDQKKHGDCYHILKQVLCQFDVSISNVADKVQLHLISPKLMQAYHELDEEKCYRKYQLIINGLRRMVGNGLTFSDGEQWKMKRRVVTKMLNFKYIRTLVPKIKDIVDNRIKQIIEQVKSNQEKSNDFDLLKLTTRMGSTVILQLFFGGSETNIHRLEIDGREVSQHMRQLMALLEQQLLNPFAIMLGKRYTQIGVTKLDKDINRLLRSFNSFTKNFVQKRLQELKHKFKEIDGKTYNPYNYVDLIEAFYVEEILKKDQTIKPGFIQSLIDDFATLYTAGTDTTSHGAFMAIYYIYTNPHVLNQLRKQIKEHIPNMNELSYESFKNCHYLEAIIMQTMRIYSSANGIFPRQAKIDHELTIGQVKIPIKKGTLISTQTVPTHYKQTIYRNPYTFDPQRFMDQQGKLVYPEPFTFMNFSAGTRGCVGRQLAMTEMKTILVMLVNGYEVGVTEGDKKMLFESFAANLMNVKFQIQPLK